MGAVAGVASLVMGGIQLLGGQSEAEALRKKGEYEKQIYDINSNMADIQAGDAIRRGDAEAGEVRNNAKRIAGAAKSSYAGQGVDVNSGSAGDTQAEILLSSEKDVATVKSNAWREAFGYKAQALNSRMQGNLAAMGAKNQANNTILSAGLKGFGYGLDAFNKFRK